MKKLITAALLAAVIMPAAAQAQSRHDRYEQRDRHDRGDRGRDDRGRHDRDRNDRDRNWRDNDWRDWRGSNRSLYSRGHWNAPFRYNRWSAGARISPNYYSPRYRIADPWRYRLPRTGAGQVWVRHYDDLLLINTRSGRVVRVINGFYW